MNFQDKLKNIARKNNSLVCVGLDSDLAKIPQHLMSKNNPQFEFNKAIIDATADLVCCYKPNSAFYEAEGADGIKQLKLTMQFLKKNYPEIPVILDAKRADIGNTNEGYARFVFDYLMADAITLHPYLGRESLKPFLERKDRGLLILCKTSNIGAGEFQDLLVAEKGKYTSGVAGWSDSGSHDSPDGGGVGKALYQYVAYKVFKTWNYNGNCGLVVGATYPSELQIVRRIVGSMLILIPGIGAQDGDVEKTVKAGVDRDGYNAIINSSRGIIFAGSGEDFAQKARNETIKLKNEINKYRVIPAKAGIHRIK